MQTSENSVLANFAEFLFRDRLKSRSVEPGAYILVVQRAHNEHLLLYFAGLEAFGLRLSGVFRQSLHEARE